MPSPKYDVRNDRILFIDLELTCEDGPMPDGQRPEIIEIAIVDVDVETLAVVNTASYFVKPVQSKVSAFCTALTGITPGILKKQGRSWEEVCNLIRKKHGSMNKAYAGWGKDRKAIEIECEHHNVDVPFSAVYYDFGRLHTLMDGNGHAVGLKQGLSDIGLTPSADHHRALDDAMELARYWIQTTKTFRGLRAEIKNETDRECSGSLTP